MRASNQFSSLFLGMICILLFAGCKATHISAVKNNNGSWDTYKLQPGLEYKTLSNSSYNGSAQSIHILIIDTESCECVLKAEHANGKLTRPSKWGRQERAIAAINGNFFNPEEGGSVCFFKEDGKLINPTIPDPEELLFLPMLDEAAVAIKDNGVRIVEQPDSGWGTLNSYPTLMSSGPLLVQNGMVQPQEEIDFISKRHARTAIGIKGTTIFLVVVDGYNEAASGMSIPELSSLMLDLGCSDALNLDGGGSSTLWIQTEFVKGVVNYPPDNKRFDHKGERKVANALLVVPK